MTIRLTVETLHQNKLALEATTSAARLQARVQQTTQAILTTLVTIQAQLAQAPVVKRRKGAGRNSQ